MGSAYFSSYLAKPFYIIFRVERGQQTFLFPINLSEEIVPSAVFYGTVVPVFTYLVVKNLIVNPFLADKKEK